VPVNQPGDKQLASEEASNTGEGDEDRRGNHHDRVFVFLRAVRTPVEYRRIDLNVR
jgi:hypothetical protein